MKRFLPVLFLLLFLNACSEKDKKTYRNKPDTVKSTVGTKVKPKDGLFIENYPNGIKKLEGVYKNGKREGLWKAYYPGGVLWSEGEYTNGQRNGFSVLYYETGIKRAEGRYKANKRSGLWLFYRTNGQELKRVDFDTYKKES